jgi:hypothetical protein
MKVLSSTPGTPVWFSFFGRAVVDENYVPWELALNGRTETVPGGKNV